MDLFFFVQDKRRDMVYHYDILVAWIIVLAIWIFDLVKVVQLMWPMVW